MGRYGDISLTQTGSLLGHKSKHINLHYAEHLNAEHLTETVREYSQKNANMIEGEERSALAEASDFHWNARKG